jgi:hypothetical protein
MPIGCSLADGFGIFQMKNVDCWDLDAEFSCSKRMKSRSLNWFGGQLCVFAINALQTNVSGVTWRKPQMVNSKTFEFRPGVTDYDRQSENRKRLNFWWTRYKFSFVYIDLDHPLLDRLQFVQVLNRPHMCMAAYYDMKFKQYRPKQL